MRGLGVLHIGYGKRGKKRVSKNKGEDPFLGMIKSPLW